MNVPFIDLQAQYASIRGDIRAAIDAVFEKGAFAGGVFVEEFERAFAAFCGVPHAVGVSSGTEALAMSLLACGVRTGDEVITVPNTFIATAEAITFCGARPVFVDIDPRTYAMDPALVERAITRRTRAIVPVHLYGHPADADTLAAIASEHGLAMIEDACQAHGAMWRGRPVGSFGRAGCFSFYPGKNLGAYGEAGAVVTRDGDLAQWLRRFRDHGQSQKNRHDFVGWNARMDGLQAAVLSVKLRHLDAWTAARRRAAARYGERLDAGERLRTPVELAGARHVYHLYVVRVPERAQFAAHLGEHGIQCGIHYPTPIHLQPAYASLGYAPGRLPVAERCMAEIVSLPMYAELSDAAIDAVAQCANAAAGCYSAMRVSSSVPSSSST